MKTFIILLLVVSNPFAQESKYYFYSPEFKQGSEYFNNPLTVFLNGSYDILRNGGHNKDITAIQYHTGFNNVWWNLSHPLTSIKQYGWKNFLYEELLPLSLDEDKAQFFPNYFHHVIGGGFIYVKTAEWYDYHGFPWPKTASLLTSTAYNLLNEATENGGYKGVNTDPIADLLIFNPLGYILFEFDFVKKFFSKTAPLYDWSLQPALTVRNMFLENAGQQFVIKYDPQLVENYSLFWYWGICGIVGITYSSDKINNFSVGAGQIVNKLKDKRRRNSRIVTPNLDGALGFFYDRENSLLASLILTGPGLYNARLNIYPGLFNIGPLDPGFFVGYGEWDKLIVGITYARIPLGISFSK